MHFRYPVVAASLLLLGCTAEPSTTIPSPPPNASRPPAATLAPKSPSKPDPAFIPPELAKYCHA
ncbi:MAG TPA: hypothetical protein VF542_00335, partial [Jatrophihabitans sp.]